MSLTRAAPWSSLAFQALLSKLNSSSAGKKELGAARQRKIDAALVSSADARFSSSAAAEMSAKELARDCQAQGLVGRRHKCR